jgi:hypothetical protein
LRRRCPACSSPAHQDIYYRRLNDPGGVLPGGLNLLSTVKNYWTTSYNQFNIDFALYSTYEDALDDTNRWGFCNFSNQLGFPRDCGPTGAVGGQWNNFLNDAYGFNAVGFYVETPDTSTPEPTKMESDNPSSTPSLNLSSNPSSLPSSVPSGVPSLSLSPTQEGTTPPTAFPTELPSSIPSADPSSSPVPTETVPTRSPITTNWFINQGVISLDTDSGPNPLVRMSHDIGTGADAVRITLYEYDCNTPVPLDDPVSVLLSETVLNTDESVEYAIEFDKTSIGSSALMLPDSRMEFCVDVGLVDGASGQVFVSRESRIKLKIDMSYALFFLEVSTDGAGPDDFDLGDIALFYVNACICSTSFTCDDPAPTIQENTLISVCLWPSDAGVKFADFSMEISSSSNGYSYSPITYENGEQNTNAFTTLQEQGAMWKVTTQVFSDIFNDGSTQAIISGEGYLEFVNSKDEELTSEAKEFMVVVALEQNGSFIDCLFNFIQDRMSNATVIESPFKFGEITGKLGLKGHD